MNRIGVLLSKEFRDILRSPGLLATLIIPMLVMTVVAILGLYAAGIDPQGFKAPPGTTLPEAIRDATPREIAQYMAMLPFHLVWFIFPISIPSTLAAHSIVGEKVEGTLEPLLATPISTGELLLGKAIAAVVPGVLLTWALYLVTWAAGTVLATPRVLAATVVSPAWIMGILVLAPTLAVLTVMMLVIVSSRVNDVRTANQFAALLLLPVVAGFVVQLFKGFSVDLNLILGLEIGALVALGFLTRLAIAFFQREAILVRWKL